MLRDWQRQRSALNHDWLKNEFTGHLRGFIARAEAATPDQIRLVEFAEQDWPKWAANRQALVELLDSAEGALSPRQLLDQPPLSACSMEIKELLSSLVHALWLARYPIRQRIAEAKAALDDAEACASQITDLLDDPGRLSSRQLQGKLEDFKEFKETVEHLSECIHRLPSSIQVV